MSKYLEKLVALQLATWDGNAVTDTHDERAKRLVEMFEAHQHGAAKYGEPNWLKAGGPPPVVCLATEFGYKQCEKGESLGTAMRAMAKLYE